MGKTKITVDVTDLWTIWTLGRITGTRIALGDGSGLSPAEADIAEETRHKDLAQVLGVEAYQKLLNAWCVDIDVSKLIDWEE